MPLTLSFRSTKPVLEAVDRVFGKAPATDGLIVTADAKITHQAHRKNDAGLVELWVDSVDVWPQVVEQVPSDA